MSLDQRIQIATVPRRLVDPREVVDPLDVHVDFRPRRLVDVQILRDEFGEVFLGVEHLVTAPERVDLRELLVERTNADRHRISVVEHPRVRTVFPDSGGDVTVDRDRPHGPDHAAGPDGVADRLVDTVLRRNVDLVGHRFGRGVLRRENDEVRVDEGVGPVLDRRVRPVADCARSVLDPVTELFVALGALVVHVVENYLSRDVGTLSEVVDKRVRPAPTSAADIADFDSLNRVTARIGRRTRAYLVADFAFHET